MRLKMASSYSTCVLFLGIVLITPALAGDTFTVENNDIWIESGGVDDHLSCSVNGREIVQGHFGLRQMLVNVGPSLQKGSNSIACKVTDNNDGSCFAYEIRIKNGFNILKTLQASCCNASCARSNPVLDDVTNIIIQ